MRALFCVVLALLFAARIAAPAGFMPVASDGGVMVTLCTGQGAVKVMVDRGAVPHPTSGHDDSGASQHCPFAGGASAPALPTPAAIALLPVWHSPTGPIALALRTGWIARLAAPPPPSSGPPALV
ncbi:MAG TPA: DUF2946 family protein [Sphingobium sp.]|nr:DUF2946 family protein [Sphingobium sp.]